MTLRLLYLLGGRKMGRGKLTDEEKDILRKNPYVVKVTDTSVVYSNKFKEHFVEEYALGKKPSTIFAEAGFDVQILGSKRIERSCARWREAYAAGTLCKFDDESVARHFTNQKKEQLDELERAKKKISKQDDEIASLKAQVEVLKKAGKLGRRRCDKKVHGKTDLCELVDATIKRYGLHNSVKSLCKALDLPRSDYYYWKATAEKRAIQEEKDLEALFFIKEAFNSCKYYKQGARSIRMILHRKYYINYSRKKIRRIMRKYGIVCPMKTTNPYKAIWRATKEDKIVPNKVKRNFKVKEARKLFLTDITYIKHQNHFTYLQMIIDAETKEPVAHSISTSLKMDFVIDSLEQLEKYDFAEGAMIHSDQGVHYTSKAFREKVKAMGLEQSMSRRGNCLDNAAMESFFGHMKQEMEFDENASDEEIEQQLETFINDYWYNRYQEGLGEMTPYEYGQSLLAA